MVTWSHHRKHQHPQPDTPNLCVHMQATAGKRVAPRDVPPTLRSAMEEDFNPSQMQAVTSGLNGSEVNLIQGPPGAPPWQAHRAQSV